MRERKYRGWDGVRFYHFTMLGIDAGSIMVRDDSPLSDGSWCEVSKLYVEDFTGLKDSEGTEIYEGDIISKPYADPMGKINHDTSDGVHVVWFLNGGFGFKTRTKFIPLIRWVERSSGDYIPNMGFKVIYGAKCGLRVIGNIHENPELIP